MKGERGKNELLQSFFSKVAYVKATDEEEARDMAMDEDYIFMDEDVVAVEPSCRAEIQKELYNFGGIYAKESKSSL